MSLFSKKTVNKTTLSLPVERHVGKYAVKKMPIGAYLNALNRLQTMPEDFMKKVFPGKTPQGVLDEFKNINEESLVNLAMAFFVGIPTYAIGFISDLTGIPEEDIINDESIGIDGITEIIEVFIEVNGLGKCIQAVERIKATTKAMTIATVNTGSND